VRLPSGLEILAMANHLLGQSTDTPGWRIHWYEREVRKTNGFQWPMKAGSRAQNLFFPDLAPTGPEVD